MQKKKKKRKKRKHLALTDPAVDSGIRKTRVAKWQGRWQLPFIELLICARHSSKQITYITSFNSLKWIELTSFCRWGNRLRKASYFAQSLEISKWPCSECPGGSQTWGLTLPKDKDFTYVHMVLNVESLVSKGKVGDPVLCPWAKSLFINCL